MVTILPKENDLSDVFQSLGSGLTQGYMNRADENAIRKAISDLGPNASMKDIINTVSGIKTYSPDSKKTAISNLAKSHDIDLNERQFEELKRTRLASEEAGNLKRQLDELRDRNKKEQDINDSLTLIDSSTLNQNEKDALRQQIKEGKASYNAIKEVLKLNEQGLKKEDEEVSRNLTQKAFNDIVNLVPKVGRSGIVSSKLGGDTAKAYAQFTSLTGALESLLVEKVNKGALSNTRFKYITETLLPKPSDTQSEITGKLTGLATILDLDPSALGVKAAEGTSDSKGRPSLSSFERK